MIKTMPGSVDGVHISTYEAGAEYDLSATDGARSLAAAFVGAGFAVDADAQPVALAKSELAAKPARSKK
jgi:hypothetical protein